MRDRISQALKNLLFLAALFPAAAYAGSSSGSTAAQPLDLAQTPLTLGVRAEPNILMILDDSGSMGWDFLPDGAAYAPWYWARYSPAYNKQYYNPAVTYRPWVNADGTEMPQASTSCPVNDPMATGSGCTTFPSDQVDFFVADFGGNVIQEKLYVSHIPKYYKRDGTKVKIKPGKNYTGSSQRTDCKNAPICTYEEEIQNFANWWTYHRTRMASAKAAVGRAFSVLDEKARVGFATIHSITPRKPVPDIRVRTFDTAHRKTFYDKLYATIPDGGTPLRRALKAAGEYYSTSAPWEDSRYDKPLACRPAYTILTTDGYWNGDSPNVGNADNKKGEKITGPGQQTYQYKPETPFKDAYKNTLADVAMYYWKRDLMPKLDNLVPTSPQDPAFWQHMTTFTVGLGVKGTLDPATDLPAIEKGDKSWPDTDSGKSTRADDLWHAAINGHGQHFSAQNPDEFAQALKSVLADIVSRSTSSAAAAASAFELSSDTLIYQVTYNPGDWSGEVVAYEVDGTTGELKSTPKWQSGKTVTQHTKVFTRAGGQTVQLTADTTSADILGPLNKDPVTGKTDGKAKTRIKWLLGTLADDTTDGLRKRGRYLGDIIHSDPVVVAHQNFGFGLSRSGLSQNERTRYNAFRSDSTYTERPPVIYVGANDGKLHAIDGETGKPLFAYIPGALLGRLGALTHPKYSHAYYVDGAPTFSDVWLDDAWKTVLVGSTGRGGQSLFALDVTRPESFTKDNVLWDVDPSASTDLANHLGVTVSRPAIARVHAGDRWVVLVGNGINPKSQQAELLVLDLKTGAVLKVLSTGVGPDSLSGTNVPPNGLGTPVPVDLDGDRITDMVYAGDHYGNVWAFDFRSEQESGWRVVGSTLEPKPLFTACDGDCDTFANRRPLLARPDVRLHPRGGVMVYVGSGRFLTQDDRTLSNSPRLEAAYGLWDRTPGQYDPIRVSDLVEQTIDIQVDAKSGELGARHRIFSSHPVDYTKKRGWIMQLRPPKTASGQGERVLNGMMVRHDRVIFTTFVPSSDPCIPDGTSWLMEVDAMTGGQLGYAVYDINKDGKIDDLDGYTPNGGTLQHIGGIGYDEIVLNPVILSNPKENKEHKYLSSSTGTLRTVDEAAGSASEGRKSWIQIQ